MGRLVYLKNERQDLIKILIRFVPGSEFGGEREQNGPPGLSAGNRRYRVYEGPWRATPNSISFDSLF
jgi:hypothetical protein